MHATLFLLALAAADVNPDDIIQKFAAKEAEFAKAREIYTYRQTVRIEEFSEDGRAGGKHEMVTDIVFTPEGKRQEKVVRAPVSTLQMVQLTPQDEEDLRNTQPFVLTSADLPKYWVRYLGKQNADEIPCYVFAVKPKKLEPGLRYFEGQIWVDDRDLQIVKSFGRGTGHLKKGEGQQFPKFETYRDQVDGKYWFPVDTRANAVLYFDESTVRLKMTVLYKDYKRFGAESSIKFGDVVKEEPKKPEPEKKP